MKKAVASVVAIAFLGIALPVTIFNSGNGGIVLEAQAKAKTQKKKKSKLEKAKEDDTTKRLKHLKSLGVPKEFYEDTYGKHLSRQELGKAIANWVVYVYQKTGSLPPLDKTDL